ncbi:DNA polymerase III subunit epsilon [Anopheles sinensis]|uniref:DNA polymerase III subunit epsilon n=1 Tax=Anopheles sinensis TaxID=74873 RepID=A0A084WIM3_ANOSI|nr:DNA polymerase III subunit epsilon [Anopheles sinensis]
MHHPAHSGHPLHSYRGMSGSFCSQPISPTIGVSKKCVASDAYSMVKGEKVKGA